jgi:hypothetical protein
MASCTYTDLVPSQLIQARDETIQLSHPRKHSSKSTSLHPLLQLIIYLSYTRLKADIRHLHLPARCYYGSLPAALTLRVLGLPVRHHLLEPK